MERFPGDTNEKLSEMWGGIELKGQLLREIPPVAFWSRVRNHQGSSYHTKEGRDVVIFSYAAPQSSFNECCLLIKETATHWRP